MHCAGPQVHFFNPKEDEDVARAWEAGENMSLMPGTMKDVYVETRVLVYSRSNATLEAVKVCTPAGSVSHTREICQRRRVEK